MRHCGRYISAPPPPLSKQQAAAAHSVHNVFSVQKQVADAGQVTTNVGTVHTLFL